MNEIPFDGLPDLYDAEAISGTLKQAFAGIQDAVSTIQSPSVREAQSGQVRPSWDNVKSITIALNSGALGSSSDPRVGYPTAYSPGGLSKDGQSQRFRFNTGVQVPVFMRLPTKISSWAVIAAAFGVPGAVTTFEAAGQGRVAFGAIVPGIKHDLGRIPERVTFRTSSGPRGPTGQLLINGGDSTYYPAGSNFRCDLDFVPVFGQTAEDIEYQLKHLLEFSGGLFGFDALVGTFPGQATYESPALLRQFASELVTTEDRFGGILLATGWGLASCQIGIDLVDFGLFAFGREATTAGLRNPVNTIPDGMAACALPDLGGKDLFALAVAQATLATMLGTGLKLTLTQGTVDFVLE